MKEMADVLNASTASNVVRAKAHTVFLKKRKQIWEAIQDGRFPKTYVSMGNKKFTGAPARTAIRCDFLLASKIALGAKYKKDKIADLAQRDLLFGVLRYREVFPNRKGGKFYCCTKCTSKLHECVNAKTFRYIDNEKWKSDIESR